MSRLLSFVVSTTILCLTLGALAADWPRFRGPNGNGISPETGLNKNWTARPPKTLWWTPMSDNGFSGPSIANGKVFIIDHHNDRDVVRALDIRTGKDIWSYSYADDSKNGWGFTRATPTVDGGKVYTVSCLGTVNCLDAGAGKLVWSRNIQREFDGKRPQWDYGMSAVVDGNKLIVCPGGKNAAVAALDKATGKTLWQGGGSDKPGYATPVIATLNGKKQYVVFTAYSLIGVDAVNGKLLWSFPWKTGSDVNAAMPLVIGNTIFITSGYGHGCALVDVTGNHPVQKWSNRLIQAHFNTPFYAGGCIYGTGDPGNLVCLDPKTGDAKWKQGGVEKGGIIAADGLIIGVIGNTGEVYIATLSPAGYHELGRIHPLGHVSNSWAPPVLANGLLFTRTTKALACISLK